MLRAAVAVWFGSMGLIACSYHRGLAPDAGCLDSRCEHDAGAATAPDAGDGALSTATGSVATGSVALPEPGGEAGEVIAEPDDDASRTIFAPERVKTYELSVAPEDLAAIDAQPSAEAYVPAQLALDGEHVDQVGLRYKGSAGAFIAPCTAAPMPGRGSDGPKVGKCSMKLAFDYVDDDARFHGLKKINLHSMGRDLTYLREQLGYSLFRAMGVAAPRTAYARVVINGKFQGLFLAVEQIDGRFTRSRFSEGGEGNLYKEVWPLYDDPKIYRTALESNKGDTTKVDKMLAFAQRVRFAPESASAWIDRDYTLRYIAVDRILINDDGVFHFYCGRSGNNPGPFANHNYYWYEAERAGRIWLVPWDLDLVLGGEVRPFIDVPWSEPASCMCHVFIGYPQRAPSCDPLVGQFASWKRDYQAIVDAFVAGPFAKAAVDAKLDAWSKQIAPYVDEAAGLGGAPDPDVWRDELLHLRYVLSLVREYRGYPYGVE